MSEAALQDAIADLARAFGWAVVHHRPARTAHGWRTPGQYDAKGFVDLLLVHPDRGLMFAEVKSERGRLTDDQRAWIDRLTEARADVHVWRPSSWPEIVNLLSGGRASA